MQLTRREVSATEERPITRRLFGWKQGRRPELPFLSKKGPGAGCSNPTPRNVTFFFLRGRGVCAHLDGVVVAVVGEALGAERAVHAVEAVHVALALVRVRVHLALTEEARPQQRLEPRRPPLVLRPVAPASSLPHSIRRRH